MTWDVDETSLTDTQKLCGALRGIAAAVTRVAEALEKPEQTQREEPGLTWCEKYGHLWEYFVRRGEPRYCRRCGLQTWTP